MRHLYNTRVEVLRPMPDLVDGLAQITWQKLRALVDSFIEVPGEMMCRIDLTLQRPGKDQPMPIVAGRAPDRVGVMFFDATTEVRSGDRVRCIDGPVQGTFELRVMPDPAVGFASVHHMEVQIVEVSSNMRPNLLNDPPSSSDWGGL